MVYSAPFFTEDNIVAVQAKDLIFNGLSLSSIDSDLKLVAFDTSPSDTDVEFMDNKFESSDISYNSPIVHFYNSTAKDTLQFDIMISNKYGEYLSQSIIKDLCNWLTSPVEPKVLSFVEYKDDEGKSVYSNVEYIGVFNKATYSEMGQSRKMGIGFTFTNISNFGFTRPFTTTINNSSGGITITSIINNGTYTGLPIYPRIEISPLEDGTVYITNLSDHSGDTFGINVTNGEDVVIEKFNVFDSDGNFYSFDNLTSLKFPCLIDGENLIEISGKCICRITYRFYVNIGV